MKCLFAIVILIKAVLVFVKYLIQNAVYFINKTEASAVGTTGVTGFFFCFVFREFIEKSDKCSL